MSLSSIVSQYRKELLQLEQQSERVIRSSHDNMLAMIRQFLSKLYAQLKQLIPIDQLKWLQNSQLQHTKQTVAKHVNQFGNVATKQVLSSQQASVNLGVQAAQAQLKTIAPSAVLSTPAQSDLHKLVGITQQSNSIPDLMGSYGDDAADKVGSALVSGVSAGKDTDWISNLVTAALMAPLYRALTTDQTSMMEAYRSSVLVTFQDNSDIAQLWKWSALPGCCAFCAGMDGTVHSIDETMESHPNCIPAGAIVSGPRVLGSTTRWYDGEVVDIETAGGNFLTVTPNHPILTPDGWVNAGQLNEGGNIISRRFTEGPFTSIGPDDYQIEAPIEQIAATFGGTLEMSTRTMPTSSEDFHGDGGGSKVHIVRSYSHLGDDINTTLFEPFSQKLLCRRHAQLLILSGLSSLDLFFQGVFATTHSIMSSFGLLTPLLRSQAGGSDNISLAHGTSLNTSSFQSSGDGATCDTVGSSKGQFGFPSDVALNDFINGEITVPGVFDNNSIGYKDLSQSADADMEHGTDVIKRLAGIVQSDQITRIRKRTFSGHVYNLQTIDGWYSANNIITHNCRCQMLIVPPGS